MEINYLTEPPEKIMSDHGKSFYFASLIFPANQMYNVATLYKLCRYIDDCADELPPDQSIEAIEKIFENEDFKKVFNEINSLGVEKHHLQHLLNGALFDARQGVVHDQQDFLTYCFQVAGVVGLMMCPLLNVRDKAGYRHAIDMGIGMQITNICRDVLEDAKNNRNYIPLNILTDSGLTLTILSQQGATPAPLKKLMSNYLKLADSYYESGLSGLAYIPLRGRFCILIASQVYRAIGIKIRKNNFNVLAERTYLSLPEKVWVSTKALMYVFSRKFWRPEKHDPSLQALIIDVPEAIL